MENQQPRHVEGQGARSVSNNSINNHGLIKKTKGLIQLAVLIILLVMFFMNLFKAPSGGNNDQSQAQMSQLLYKMLDIPQIGALGSADKQTSYQHVPRNRTGD